MGGKVILLARIVDASGNLLQRADIAAVRFTAQALGRTETGQEMTALDLDEVLCDALQTLWSTDDVGYNFRHEIGELPADGGEPGVHVELTYELTPARGQKTIVRFKSSRI
jgi:hypothetical protein